MMLLNYKDFGTMIILIYSLWFILCPIMFINCEVLVPRSPCPEIFKYESSSWNEIHGVLFLKNDFSGNYNLEVNMTLKAFTNQDLAIKRVTSITSVQNGEDLVYHIIFPYSNAIPEIQTIVFNNNMRCVALPDLGPRNYGFTSLNAVEYLSTGVVPRRPQNFKYQIESTTKLFPERPYAAPLQPAEYNVLFSPLKTENTNNFASIFVVPQTQTSEKQVLLTEAQVTTKVTSLLYNRYSNSETDCGNVEDTQSLLVHASPTTEGQYPWLIAMFHLQETGDYKFKCAGNLVSQKHVITAAHCIRLEKTYDLSKDNIILVLGKHNIRSWATRSEIRDIKEMFVHPDYSKPSDADIAVLVMQKEVEFTRFIKPICLWSKNESFDSIVGAEGVVVGWGKDELYRDYVPEPRQLVMPAVSQEDCLRSDERFLKLTSERTFCAGTKKGAGACTGDSGGGFIIKKNGRWVLRGIVSSALVNLKHALVMLIIT